MAERRFKFTWSRTWPDREQDYVAADGERRIGRVYRLAGFAERWKWNMTASIGNRLGSTKKLIRAHATKRAMRGLLRPQPVRSHYLVGVVRQTNSGRQPSLDRPVAEKLPVFSLYKEDAFAHVLGGRVIGLQPKDLRYRCLCLCRPFKLGVASREPRTRPRVWQGHLLERLCGLCEAPKRIEGDAEMCSVPRRMQWIEANGSFQPNKCLFGPPTKGQQAALHDNCVCIIGVQVECPPEMLLGQVVLTTQETDTRYYSVAAALERVEFDRLALPR